MLNDLPTPTPIREQQWPVGTIPLVSICCITYNHAAFIRDAVEGFLIQKTTFPVEILIHDDASTDGTHSIIQEYAAQHPHLVRPIIQTTNQFSRGNRPRQFLGPLIRGRYIALCEGDDFWTDPLKLQIQVDYLEQHPDCVISGHDAYIQDDEGNRISDSKLPDDQKRNWSPEDLQCGRAWILTMSWVYRNVLQHEPIPEHSHIVNGDSFLTSLLGQHGGSKFHPDIRPACYRRHPGGIWSMKSMRERADDTLNSFFWIYRYWHRVGEHRIAAVWFEAWSKEALRKMTDHRIFSSPWFYQWTRQAAIRLGPLSLLGCLLTSFARSLGLKTLKQYLRGTTSR